MGRGPESTCYMKSAHKNGKGLAPNIPASTPEYERPIKHKNRITPNKLEARRPTRRLTWAAPPSPAAQPLVTYRSDTNTPEESGSSVRISVDLMVLRFDWDVSVPVSLPRWIVWWVECSCRDHPWGAISPLSILSRSCGRGLNTLWTMWGFGLWLGQVCLPGYMLWSFVIFMGPFHVTCRSGLLGWRSKWVVVLIPVYFEWFCSCVWWIVRILVWVVCLPGYLLWSFPVFVGRFHVTCRFGMSTQEPGRLPIFMKRSVVSKYLTCLWKTHMSRKRWDIRDNWVVSVRVSCLWWSDMFREKVWDLVETQLFRDVSKDFGMARGVSE
jgi:hypothetical protein